MEEKANELQAQLVNSFHQHCMISAYSCGLMQAKPVVFDTRSEKKLTVNNTIAKNSRCIRTIQRHLVPHATAYLGSQWSSSAAGGAMSALIQYVVQTNNWWSRVQISGARAK